MTKRVVLIAAVAGVLVGGVTTAQTPFGDDDEGHLPPTRRVALCENAIAKALAKAVVCLAKCHQARALGKLQDDTAEDACESNVGRPTSCKSKFNSVRDRLLSEGGCPTCLDQLAMDQVFAQGAAFVNTNVSSQVYCAQ